MSYPARVFPEDKMDTITYPQIFLILTFKIIGCGNILDRDKTRPAGCQNCMRKTTCDY